MSAFLGISLSDLREVGELALVELESQWALSTLFARGVWSRLAEPGDSVAGLLVASLGPARALELVASNAPLEEVQACMKATHPFEQEEANSKKIQEGLRRWQQRLNLKASFSDFRAARHLTARLVTPEQQIWPSSLSELDHHAPLALWTRGDAALLSTQAVAVVGSRAATAYGEHVTEEISRGIATSGTSVVSGGAHGIDAVAHRAALAVDGATIAVFAGGIDRLYPSGHESLFHTIEEHGVLCAELPPGSSPTKWRFLQRNRLIAALAAAAVVCEAGFRSGSLNTAGHAAQLGRPLGAVPGPVTSATSAGCHRLLREYDAVCIRNSRDVLELLGSDLSAQHTRSVPGTKLVVADLSHDELRVLDALSGSVARTSNLLAQATGMSRFEASDALAELLLRGMVRQRGEGWVRVAQ